MTTTQVVETSLSTTTVLFRTTITRTTMLLLLMKWLLGSNLSQTEVGKTQSRVKVLMWTQHFQSLMDPKKKNGKFTKLRICLCLNQPRCRRSVVAPSCLPTYISFIGFSFSVSTDCSPSQRHSRTDVTQRTCVYRCQWPSQVSSEVGTCRGLGKICCHWILSPLWLWICLLTQEQKGLLLYTASFWVCQWNPSHRITQGKGFT